MVSMPDIHYWEEGRFAGQPQYQSVDIVIPHETASNDNLLTENSHHEAGHTYAAHLFKTDVKGIVLHYRPNAEVKTWNPAAVWGSDNIAPKDESIVLAAGAAAEKMFTGSYSLNAAKVDRADLKKLTGDDSEENFAALVEIAVELLTPHRAKIDAIAQAISHALRTDAGLLTGVEQPQSQWRRVVQLSPEHRGVYLLTKQQLEAIFQPPMFSFNKGHWECLNAGSEWRGICRETGAKIIAPTKKELQKTIKETK